MEVEKYVFSEAQGRLRTLAVGQEPGIENVTPALTYHAHPTDVAVYPSFGASRSVPGPWILVREEHSLLSRRAECQPHPPPEHPPRSAPRNGQVLVELSLHPNRLET